MLNYCYYNPNIRGAITGDCVKRAIVVAADIDYRELELMMRRNKVNKERPFNDIANYEHIIDMLGGKTVKMKTPAMMDTWHVNTIDKVMHAYPHVSFILRVSHHLIGVKDGTIYDLFDDRPRDKSIYKMWIFGATEEEHKQIQEQCSKGPGWGRFTL